MKLEDQICSLELAKRLKELGIKQASFFYWCEGNPNVFVIGIGGQDSIGRIDAISAFTCSELGEMLLRKIENMSLRIGSTGSSMLTVWYENGTSIAKAFDDYSEADARAKILIYLLEQGLLKP